MPNVPPAPQELIDAIKDGKSTVFVGAGLSMAATFPSWPELLLSLTDNAVKAKVINKEKAKELKGLLKKQPNKLLMVAQELSDDFGQEAFQNEIAKVFDDDKKVPTKTHLLLPQIPFSSIVTTNYDQLLETAYIQKNKTIPKTFTHQDSEDFSDALWRGEFFILKAHGSVRRKSSIILTQKDYRTIIHSSVGYRSVLSAIFTIKTVLFLGVSFDDPELELLLGFLHDAFHGSGPYHYALVPDTRFSQTVANRWRKDYKVTCLSYTPSPGHPEVEAFVRNLHRKTSP